MPGKTFETFEVLCGILSVTLKSMVTGLDCIRTDLKPQNWVGWLVNFFWYWKTDLGEIMKKIDTDKKSLDLCGKPRKPKWRWLSFVDKKDLTKARLISGKNASVQCRSLRCRTFRNWNRKTPDLNFGQIEWLRLMCLPGVAGKKLVTYWEAKEKRSYISEN